MRSVGAWGAWGVLGLAAIDQLAIAMSQQGLSVLSVAFQAYSHLSVGRMGMLFATVALGAVAGMVPAGVGIDRFGPRSIALLSGAWIAVVLGLLSLFLPRSFWVLEGALALVGFALPALSLTGATAISLRFDGTGLEGTALGIRQAATPIGGILAASLYPILVKTWSLSAVLMLIAVNAGGWTILFGATLPPHRHPTAESASTFSPAAAGRLLLRLRQPLLVSLMLAPGQYALLTYALLDLHDVWRRSTESAGLLLAVALFAGFLARIVLGRREDRAHNAQKLLQATTAFGVVAALAWAAAPPFLADSALVVLFAALGVGLDGWNALMTVWLADSTDATERGLALGLGGMSSFVGVVLFLPAFGWLVQVSHSFRPGWALLAAAYAAATVLAGKRNLADRRTAP
jgi:MFS family permease